MSPPSRPPDFIVGKIERDEEWAKPASFRKARIRRAGSRVEPDWAHNSAFRFFPIVQDDLRGWRPRLLDTATNKAPALSARVERLRG